MNVSVGDKVRYTVAFCQQIAADPEVANLRGIVQAIIPAIQRGGAKIPERARVVWDGETEAKSAFTRYLQRC